MKTVYIDMNHVCHLTDDGTRTAFETDVFDNTLDAAVECYKIFLEDGKQPLIQCYDSAAEKKIENQHSIDEDNHLTELAELVEEIYNEDMEVIG